MKKLKTALRISQYILLFFSVPFSLIGLFCEIFGYGRIEDFLQSIGIIDSIDRLLVISNVLCLILIATFIIEIKFIEKKDKRGSE